MHLPFISSTPPGSAVVPPQATPLWARLRFPHPLSARVNALLAPNIEALGAFGLASVSAYLLSALVASGALALSMGVLTPSRGMTRLRELTQPSTTVIRNGRAQDVPTDDVVVGDIVVLSEGSRVPADLRLLESRGLQLDEASLTGETFPALKAIDEGGTLGQRAAGSGRRASYRRLRQQ